MRQSVRAPASLGGVVSPPGDKSISHRAALLNSIAQGTGHVSNFCVGDDRTAMFRCLRGLGAIIRRHTGCSFSGDEECFEIRGNGPEGLSEPSSVLNAGNSGTTMRLVSGLLAAQPFFSVISGDRYLRQRPMGRIVEPLTEMGASVTGRAGSSLAPLAIRGGDLQGIDYTLPVASAQLKSCILIAGLHARGQTTVRQPAVTRDHTERMMASMGADLNVDGLDVSVRRSQLTPVDVRVPADSSGAAFWLVAGCCHPNARVEIKNVGLNPSRAGVLEILSCMGGRVRVSNVREEGGRAFRRPRRRVQRPRGCRDSGRNDPEGHRRASRPGPRGLLRPGDDHHTRRWRAARQGIRPHQRHRRRPWPAGRAHRGDRRRHGDSRPTGACGRRMSESRRSSHRHDSGYRCTAGQR